MFLPVEEFHKAFPMGKRIGKGGYGNVFITEDGAHVVKEQKSDAPGDVFQSTMKEVTMYASLRHPAILTMTAFSFRWSNDTLTSYIALPVGKKLGESHDFTALATQLLSAVAFLDEVGVVHNDLKPENVVIHEKRAKLIDFGISQVSLLYDAGQYFYYARAPILDDYRSSGYMHDPQVKSTNLYGFSDAISSTKGELHGVAHILDYHTDRATLNINLMKDLRHFPVASRLTARQILDKYHLSVLEGEVMETLPIMKDRACSATDIEATLRWVCQLCGRFGYQARTMFLAVHLFQRIYGTVAMSAEDLRCYGAVCLFLATCTLETADFPFKELRDIVGKDFPAVDFTVQVIAALEGILFTYTYWDSALSGDDLPFLLEMSMQCDYAYPSVPQMPAASTGGTSKNVPAKVVVARLPNSIRQVALADVQWTDGGARAIHGAPPAPLPISVREIESARTNEDYYTVNNLFCYHHEQLPMTSAEEGARIYLAAKGYVNGAFMRKSVRFDYDEHRDFPFLAFGINPFTATDEQLENAVMPESVPVAEPVAVPVVPEPERINVVVLGSSQGTLTGYENSITAYQSKFHALSPDISFEYHIKDKSPEPYQTDALTVAQPSAILVYVNHRLALTLGLLKVDGLYKTLKKFLAKKK